MTQLIYETADGAFADRVLEAMRQAKIPCYRTGGSGYTSSVGLPTGENQICVFVSNKADLPRANEILRNLGGDTSGTSFTQFKWFVRIIASCLVGAVLWLVYKWAFATDL